MEAADMAMMETAARSMPRPMMTMAMPTARMPSTETLRTMEISRIFWEKATAIHVYCLQGTIGQFVRTN